MELDNMNPIIDGQEGVVDSPSGGDTGESALYSESGAADRERSHEFNSAMRSARLQGRKEAEAAMKSEFARSGLQNPDTGKPFASFEEFKAFNDAKHEEKVKSDAAAAGKSVEEYREDLADRDYVRGKRKEEEEAAEKRRGEDRLKEFARNDARDFAKRYPDVDPAQLETNERFRKFAKGRLYKEPLADIYEDYAAFTSESELAALARKESKESRGTGSGNSAKEITLTPDETKALAEWNERNPDMKMTAKEFKAR